MRKKIEEIIFFEKRQKPVEAVESLKHHRAMKGNVLNPETMAVVCWHRNNFWTS